MVHTAAVLCIPGIWCRRGEGVVNKLHTALRSSGVQAWQGWEGGCRDVLARAPQSLSEQGWGLLVACDRLDLGREGREGESRICTCPVGSRAHHQASSCIVQPRSQGLAGYCSSSLQTSDPGDAAATPSPHAPCLQCRCRFQLLVPDICKLLSQCPCLHPENTAMVCPTLHPVLHSPCAPQLNIQKRRKKSVFHNTPLQPSWHTLLWNYQSKVWQCCSGLWWYMLGSLDYRHLPQMLYGRA